VTCFPDIQVWTRAATDELLLLGCDGVWDVMSSLEGAELVRDILLSGETSMELVAEEVVDIALQKGLSELLPPSHTLPSGSRDNISAVVVKLPGAPEPTSSEGVLGRRSARERDMPSERR
jgi:serine/threonine protein phosphatase PrpC